MSCKHKLRTQRGSTEISINRNKDIMIVEKQHVSDSSRIVLYFICFEVVLIHGLSRSIDTWIMSLM
jgi:hypothetical protein